MKKFILITIALVTATSVFALPPPKVSAPKHGGGPKLVFRSDITSPPPYKSSVSRSPNRAMANAVAISGFIAIGARFLEEATTPPKDYVIVVPEGVEGPIVIKEQEPVVKHPVPISPIPIEVMRSH